MPHIAGVSRRQFEITPDLMLRAYRAGLFPMAETRRGDRLYWLDPEQRGVLPLDRFHLPRRLRRTVLSGAYTITTNQDFHGVISACAAPGEGREDTWINPEIERLFGALHRMGHAHSVEAWLPGEGGPQLAGGLYGVALGGAFFGESMFSRARDASKVALVHLVARLRLFGFTLLDAQFQTAHLAQFGCREVPRQAYKRLLSEAVEEQGVWQDAVAPEAVMVEIHRLGQLSHAPGDTA
ncbi:leucyl/phenylalanyl-tRNA--protein transferase [Falsiroseomonas sp.]|uniref:leucyl/phenylalanyl-tRNA--protein transferase n=1 Tax=Falsiroseomonas sp. TaxID=2870721 RepID=UPI00273458ED|nr:leucyl/phenylalanyl-tRNA--protein transferase [Falsiroseomonas sp.]MDP3417931.1 leucyl/phenylalanyl-tRNA--protein transferase [Falsiroseomonas sp.]